MTSTTTQSEHASMFFNQSSDYPAVLTNLDEQYSLRLKASFRMLTQRTFNRLTTNNVFNVTLRTPVPTGDHLNCYELRIKANDQNRIFFRFLDEPNLGHARMIISPLELPQLRLQTPPPRPANNRLLADAGVNTSPHGETDFPQDLTSDHQVDTSRIKRMFIDELHEQYGFSHDPTKLQIIAVLLDTFEYNDTFHSAEQLEGYEANDTSNNDDDAFTLTTVKFLEGFLAKIPVFKADYRNVNMPRPLSNSVDLNDIYSLFFLTHTRELADILDEKEHFCVTFEKFCPLNYALKLKQERFTRPLILFKDVVFTSMTKLVNYCYPPKQLIARIALCQLISDPDIIKMLVHETTVTDETRLLEHLVPTTPGPSTPGYGLREQSDAEKRKNDWISHLPDNLRLAIHDRFNIDYDVAISAFNRIAIDEGYPEEQMNSDPFTEPTDEDEDDQLGAPVIF